MEKTKLTVRLERDLLEQAKRYAQDHETNLTRLIDEYLRYITSKDKSTLNAPIVERLSGSLTQDVDIDDYKQYLEEKYGRAD
ncbi:MAG: DUF6364 family protein [Candidatus Promineifilaceae bacterium]|nr:DUF6364 family protein [Candidatus Promineifilaceae bacterium]